jgi:hypothetical protein
MAMGTLPSPETGQYPHMRPRTRAILGMSLLLATSGLALPADAAGSHALRVTTLDRAGTAVPSRAYAVDVKTHKGYPVEGGRRTLPSGTYAVTAVIPGGPGVQTVGTKVVSLTRDRTVSLDARQGNPVRFKVDEPGAMTDRVYAMPLVDGVPGIDAFPEEPTVTGTYAIPMTHRAVTFLAQATLVKRDARPSPYVYSLAHLHPGGIPADVSYSDRTARLARVDVAVRSFGPGQYGSLVLQPRPRTGPIWSGPYLGDSSVDLGALPRTVRTYRSPGLRWTTLASIADAHWTSDLYDATDDTVFRAGEKRTRTYGGGVWGLTRNSWLAQTGRTLQVSFGTSPLCLTSLDPNPPDCRMLRTTVHRGVARVAIDGKVVEQGSGLLKVRMPLELHDYEVTFTATRPDATTADRAKATWRFSARGLDPDYLATLPMPLVQFGAEGLNGRNEAKRGGTTTLTARVYRATPGVTGTLGVEASADGRPWRTADVTRSGGGWMVRVRNPDAAGAMSLRASYAEAGRVSTTQTSYRAYGVG